MVEEDEINLLELLQVLVRRKRLIAVMCVAAALLSAAYSLTLPNIYTGTARVLPPQKDGGAVCRPCLVGRRGPLPDWPASEGSEAGRISTWEF